MSEEPRRKWDRWPAEFRQRALERMKSCQNVKVLAKELGVARQLLYLWRQQAEGRLGGRLNLRSPAEGVRVFGGGAGCIFAARRRLGVGSEFANIFAAGGSGKGGPQSAAQS